jgi:Asp-tRNA(Asn)/Glu-tRNA(Gln) amidotransferase A subunit family amidase
LTGRRDDELRTALRALGRLAGEAILATDDVAAGAGELKSHKRGILSQGAMKCAGTGAPVSLADKSAVAQPVSEIGFILIAEAAAAFDELTRSDEDSLLVRQMEYAWPNTFRAARFIPAVEYIQANRIRTLLIEEFHQLIKDFDVIITPTFEGTQMLTTNLTGQPVITLPHGFAEDGTPRSITFLGNLYEEHKILALAKAFQNATTFHEVHPPGFIE